MECKNCRKHYDWISDDEIGCSACGWSIPLPASESSADKRRAGELLESLWNDGHMASRRDCKTCQQITDFLGEPFGCCYLKTLPDDGRRQVRTPARIKQNKKD